MSTSAAVPPAVAKPVARPLATLALLVASTMAVAWASESPEIRLTIRNKRFVPAEVTVPANTKVKLVIVNQDSTPEEFESKELNREKLVAGGGTITVYVGPLKPGRYPFFGDFNQATAQGALLAR